jgi:hypothetical protein
LFSVICFLSSVIPGLRYGAQPAFCGGESDVSVVVSG